MENTIKARKESRFHMDFKKFFVLVKLLLQDKLKISFKSNFKGSIIKVVSLIVGFAVVTAASYGFYTLCSALTIFSVLPFVPEEVPSILSTAVLLLTIISCTGGLVKYLYYSVDNRLMITYPCNGNTIFFARLFVFFINEFIRSFIIQIPLLLGYLIFSHIPLGMAAWLILAFAVITIVVVLLGGILSIPVYYISRFLNKNTLVKFIVYLVIFAAFVTLVTLVISIIPNNLDIFSNWGPYFTAIQNALKGFRTYCYPFYVLTQFTIGKFDGFRTTPFSMETLYVGLILIGSALILFLLNVIVVNPIYFKLASQSFEFEDGINITSKKTKKRGFLVSQFHKDFMLFVKNPSFLMGIFATFVFMPILLALLDKIFGAMQTNINGDKYVIVINVLIILIISLNSNSIISRMYSDEGSAFNYNKVYPRKSPLILTSKLISPLSIGTVSIIVSCIIFQVLKGITIPETIIMIFAILFIYYGHALFAAQSDFTNTSSNFARKSEASKVERNVTIWAFVISIIITVLFYFYTIDGLLSSFIKLLIIGILYLAFNVVFYIKKIQLVYNGG